MRRLLILCNALDDTTRTARGIGTDSPAASLKIFLMARAVRGAGVSAAVISLGRGRRSGGSTRFPSAWSRPRRVPTLYLPFVNRPVASELVSLLAAAIAVARLAGSARNTTLLLYNRSLAYVAAAMVARLCGMRVVLDLEDGYTGSGNSIRERLTRFGNRVFDWLCPDGALLACTALSSATRLRPTLVYYGVVDDVRHSRRIADTGLIMLLFGGTVARDTGGDLFAAAIETLRRERPQWAARLAIEITGKGDAIPRLTALASASEWPTVRVWGRTTDDEYAAIGRRATVGLALKPNNGPLAHTTFPSKVVEMAAAGQLVVTTDISDVRRVLGDDGAVYVISDTVEALIGRLRWIVENPAAALLIAARGTQAVARACDPAAAGRRLVDFLGAPPR